MSIITISRNVSIHIITALLHPCNYPANVSSFPTCTVSCMYILVQHVPSVINSSYWQLNYYTTKNTTQAN